MDEPDGTEARLIARTTELVRDLRALGHDVRVDISIRITPSSHVRAAVPGLTAPQTLADLPDPVMNDLLDGSVGDVWAEPETPPPAPAKTDPPPTP